MTKTLNTDLASLKKDLGEGRLELSQALGRQIRCDDGITREIENITHSAGDFSKAIVNAVEGEHAGHAVSLVDLFDQMRGTITSEADRKEFETICKSFRFEYKKPERTHRNKGKKPKGLSSLARLRLITGKKNEKN